MTFGGVRSALLILLFVGGVCLGVAGCNKKPADTGGGTPAPGPMGGGGPDSATVLAKLPGGAEFAVGKKVYADNKCAQCHKLGETGGGPGGMMGGPPGAPDGTKGGPPGGPGRGGMGGPDLTKVGAEPEHTKQWLTDHVRNPKAHKPQSRMPASGADKISDSDLSALADYLASRK